MWFSGHNRSIPIADHCGSMPIKKDFKNWSKMWLNKDHYQSIPINKDTLCSIKPNADQCGSLQIQKWSALICIYPHWSLLSKIDLHLSTLGPIPEVWSLLIGIDWHWGLNPACPGFCRTFTPLNSNILYHTSDIKFFYSLSIWQGLCLASDLGFPTMCVCVCLHLLKGPCNLLQPYCLILLTDKSVPHSNWQWNHISICKQCHVLSCQQCHALIY